MSLNLHVSPQSLTGISRILKQTAAIEKTGSFERIEIVGHRAGILPDTEVISPGRSIIRLAAFGGDKRQFGLFRKLCWFAMWGGRVAWRYKRADVACVNAHSLSVLPLCWLIAVFNRAALVYDTHELETETATLAGRRKQLAKLIERLFVRRCDCVVTVTSGITRWYADEYPGVSPLTVRNVPEIAERRDEPPNLRAMFDVPQGSLLFIHTGNLVAARNIPLLLEVFSAEDVDHHLLFLGSGVYEDDVAAAARQRSNIHVMPPVPHDQVVLWVRAADVGLCLIERSSQSYELALPNKLFETLLARIGLISTYLSEAHELLGDQFLDFCLEDAREEFPQIMRLNDHEILTRFATSTRDLSIPSWDDEVEPMVRMIRSLVAGRG